MNWNIGKASHPGLKRKGANQDAVGVYRQTWFERPRPPLLVLADGMGGYRGGAVASRIVVDSLLSVYREAPGGTAPETLLKDGVERAHARIQRRAAWCRRLAGMGSTVVAVIPDGERLHLVNAGDSRAYLLRGGKLVQISQDQSRAAEMVRNGELTDEEARLHPERNRLTMSISVRRETVESYFTTAALEPGDRLLLCSDGLWSVVPGDEICYYLGDFEPQAAADDLVRQALEYGGPDNISAIVCCRSENQE